MEEVKNNNVHQFTDDDLIEMAAHPNYTKNWKIAFETYNSDKKNTRLSPACRPCYNKVLAYILKIRFNKI